MTAPVYCALVHHPVRDREGQTVTAAVTNIDVHDIARVARTGQPVSLPISPDELTAGLGS